MIASVYDMALNALKNSHCCGQKRFKSMALNLVFQMNEPRIFKAAFKSWVDFDTKWYDSLPT
jgi:hypothetical protein